MENRENFLPFKSKQIFVSAAFSALIAVLAVIFNYFYYIQSSGGDILSYLSEIFIHLSLYFSVGIFTYAHFNKKSGRAIALGVIATAVIYLAVFFIIDSIYTAISPSLRPVVISFIAVQLTRSLVLFFTGVIIVIVTRALTKKNSYAFVLLFPPIFMVAIEFAYNLIANITSKDGFVIFNTAAYLRIVIAGVLGYFVSLLAALLLNYSAGTGGLKINPFTDIVYVGQTGAEETKIPFPPEQNAAQPPIVNQGEEYSENTENIESAENKEE